MDYTCNDLALEKNACAHNRSDVQHDIMHIQVLHQF